MNHTPAPPPACLAKGGRLVSDWGLLHAPLFAFLLLLLGRTGLGAQETRDTSTFAAWQAQHQEAVAQFQRHLFLADLHQVLELPELLKSASAWRDCKADPYALPPPEQWPSVLSVLRLLRELQSQGVLGAFSVHSGYRGPQLNECAGGAKGSAHLRSFAIDLTPIGSEDLTPRLCRFWREHGRQWQMGFSRYPSGRLHIDTAGYRTWGADHTGQSAVCSAD